MKMNDINNSLKNLGINRINSLLSNNPLGSLSKSLQQSFSAK